PLILAATLTIASAVATASVRVTSRNWGCKNSSSL
ncbi:MAG: hypothetical protein ACI945_002323, partial [Pseudohongiellaceae bacterium]